jgi:hypothetical protein
MLAPLEARQMIRPHHRAPRPHPRVAALAVLTALGALGCGPAKLHGGDAGTGDARTDGSNGQPHTLQQIVVTPTNAIIELDLHSSAAKGFIATGNYLDATTEDLTSQVTWSVDNAAVGTMSGAILTIPGFASANAVTGIVTAKLGTVEGKGQVTIVAYRRSGPQPDFFFVLPYTDPAGNQTKPLTFSTAIPALDVFFLMDTTGSMYGEISNLQSALTGTVVPGIKAAVPNAQFGVGALEDFPVDGYGNLAGSDCGRGGEAAPDQPFKLRQAITADVTLVQAGVNSLSNGTGPIGCGADWPEGGLEAVYQVATGEGLTGPAPTSVPANHTGVGGVAFRAGSMPVVVDITDAMSHGVGETGSCVSTGEVTAYDANVAAFAHSRAQTKAALAGICARVVGVAAIQTSLDATCSGQEYIEDLATTTGARVPPEAWDVGGRPAGCAAGQCCTSFGGAGRAPDAQGLCPVVFLANPDGSGVTSSIVTGIQMLTRFATFDVTSDRQGGTTDITGAALPAPHTTADFLKSITPVSFVKPAPPPVLPDPTFDAVAFHTVTPETQVTFSLVAFNDFVPQTSTAQIFRATIRVLAGGCTPLDQRDVLILVPPTPIAIQ